MFHINCFGEELGGKASARINLSKIFLKLQAIEEGLETSSYLYDVWEIGAELGAQFILPGLTNPSPPSIFWPNGVLNSDYYGKNYAVLLTDGGWRWKK
ncbi:MAG: hypothetical protein IPL83_03930 [Bdellovibrionales bacterium]|nr:hypothetical protein [Bdellovibrionales bacterium]